MRQHIRHAGQSSGSQALASSDGGDAPSAERGGSARLPTDGEQFAALIPLHTNAMMRVATALVGAADAEDAAQEALMRAWRAWHTLNDLSALRPWLLRITVNVCYQWQRGSFGKRVQLTQPLPDDDTETIGSELLAQLSADPGASDHMGALDLRHAINQLSTDFRMVIVLRYYVGMDSTEIGAALSIPTATVRTRQHRALHMLREYLRQAGVTPPKRRTGQTTQIESGR